MANIKRSVIVPFTPEIIYNLVTDIENYPKYLPWCSSTQVLKHTEHEIDGVVHIEYLKIKTHFATKNINTPFSKIQMSFLDGPFKSFSGEWNFMKLGENGCKIDFELHYQFSNILLEKAIGPVFSYITKNIVDAFIQEAKNNHG